MQDYSSLKQCTIMQQSEIRSSRLERLCCLNALRLENSKLPEKGIPSSCNICRYPKVFLIRKGLTSPKSIKMMLELSTDDLTPDFKRKLSGFKSQWKKPSACSFSRRLINYIPIYTTVFYEKVPLRLFASTISNEGPFLTMTMKCMLLRLSPLEIN